MSIIRIDGEVKKLQKEVKQLQAELRELQEQQKTKSKPGPKKKETE